MSRPARDPGAIDPAFLAWVRARCAIDDGEDGCWVWQLYLSQGAPEGKYLGERLIVRRRLLEQMDGSMAPGRVAGCKCKTDACVRPEHLVSRSRSALAKGRVLTLAHKAKLAAAGRKRAKLTLDKALEIRFGDETLEVAAQRMGVSTTLAGQIRRGESWKDYSSPFAGLGARA